MTLSKIFEVSGEFMVLIFLGQWLARSQSLNNLYKGFLFET